MRFRNEMRLYFNFVTMLIMAATLFALPAAVLGQGRLVRVPAREVKADLTVTNETAKTETPDTFEAEPETTCSNGHINFTDGGTVSGSGTSTRRQYSGGGVNVRARAWSRTKGSGGTWAAAYLGSYGSAGLGVTDTSESGNDPDHKVDNIGRLNYIVFAFDQPVSPHMVQLESVSNDSDITVYVGTVANAYNSAPTPSDTLLAGFFTENNNGGSSARDADINAGNVVGNVLIVAARIDQETDNFKVANVNKNCQSSTRITFVKEVLTVSNTNASTQSFGFTSTGTPSSFNLVDNNVTGPDRITMNVTAGSPVTVTENLTVGWTLGNLVCTGTAASVVDFTNRKVTVTAQSNETATCTFTNFQLGASAAKATISGRATMGDSRGVSGAILTLQNLSTGETRSVTSNSFGNYAFEDVEVGNFYMVSITHRRVRFAESSKFVDLSDNLAGFDFTGGF